MMPLNVSGECFAFRNPLIRPLSRRRDFE